MDYRRLKRILTNMKEIEGDIAKWERDYEEVPPQFKLYLEETFRSYIRIYHELVVKYLSLCNKQQLYTNRGKKAYNIILDLHIGNGDIPYELKLFLINLQNIRNRFSHEYKVPSFEEIRRFYMDNKDNFKLLYNVILDKYNTSEDKVDTSTKQMKLF